MTYPYHQYPYHYPYPAPYHPGPPPENNMVWAILSTVLCCVPLGIVAIVKADKVTKLWAQGRYDEAHEAASSAGLWSLWSAVVAIVGTVGFFVVAVLVAVAGAPSAG